MQGDTHGPPTNGHESPPGPVIPSIPSLWAAHNGQKLDASRVLSMLLIPNQFRVECLQSKARKSAFYVLPAEADSSSLRSVGNDKALG